MGVEAFKMSESDKPVTIESLDIKTAAPLLQQTRAFAEVDPVALETLGSLEKLSLPAGAVVSKPGDPVGAYWFVISGEILADRIETDGTRNSIGVARARDGFGETPLLTGKKQMTFLLTAKEPSVLLRMSTEQFWTMMSCCEGARQVILADMAQRLQAYQVEALHREKLVSLGTLAAGLMHELHNPGSAAKRAASQLRENLMKLQELSLRNGGRQKTPEQLGCMKGLLEHSMKSCRFTAMSSIEQADAEEAMGEWLSSAGVENAYNIAPVLVGMGFDRHELDCAREYFDASAFSDALNWLGALVSSVSLVCAIEESITRISDLAMAVKKFAYDERNPGKDLDIHDSLQSTLTILGHKLRLKQIGIEKKFEAGTSVIHTRGSALSQVWTNLIDNAADASPSGEKIEIATWSEPGWLAVSIGDHGTGIPPEVLPRIFEPFFTTKPQGSGTGLGLEIVHRIVTQKFGGSIAVESKPGETRFIVRLPMTPQESQPEPGKLPDTIKVGAGSSK